jgi:sRNA-binding protein
MSTITLARRRKANATDWPAYREQRAYLADLFAVIAYSGQPKRPLSLTAKASLVAANTGLTPYELKHFLRAYTFGPKYLVGLRATAKRYALDGSVDGAVTDEEAACARLCLDTHYRDKKRARERRAVAKQQPASVVPVTLVAARVYAEAA